MKAAQYVTKYKAPIDQAVANGEMDTLVKQITLLITDLMEDGIAVAVLRSGGKTPNNHTMLGVIRETDLKYRAIANQIDALSPNGYKNFIETEMGMKVL